MYLYIFYVTESTELDTLSLHDALPIFRRTERVREDRQSVHALCVARTIARKYFAHFPRAFALNAKSAPRARLQESLRAVPRRSEEHTSELQSPDHLVCRLLLEKKKKNT